MKFQLFLDESGDFENDKNQPKSWRPSLIGGLLVEHGLISHSFAKQMINKATGKNTLHCNQETGSTTIKVLKELKKTKHEIIIFENSEKLVIIDSTTTYLNIMAEGIIQLLTRLAVKYGKVNLEVMIASRKNVSQGTGIIQFSSYEKILREKILVGIAKNELSSRSLPEFKIRLGDARYDEMLMLADAVCNGFLTQDAKVKFNCEERKYLKQYFQHANVTSLTPKIETQINEMLQKNKISDAIFTLLLEYSQGNKKSESLFMELVVPRLKAMRIEEVDTQLLKVTLEIGHLVKIQKEIPLAKKIGVAVHEFLIPMMRREKIKFNNVFTLDVMLYLYTVYTHDGDAEAEKLDEIFNLELKKVDDLVKKLNYYIMYQNRKSVHLINFLEYESSIEVLTSIINACNDLLCLLKIIDDENLQSINKFTQLGKLYGTRGQAYTKLIVKDSLLFEKALIDFNEAIKHFENEKDIERQYVYSASACIQVDQIENALNYLLKCEKMDGLSQQTLIDCCDKWAGNYKDNIFKINELIKIVSVSNDDLYNGDFLLSVINKSKLDLSKLYKELNKEIIYPLPIIFWNLAKYYKSKGNSRLVKENIEKSLHILKESPDSAYILNFIKVAINGWHYQYYRDIKTNFIDKENIFLESLLDFQKKLLDNNQLNLLKLLNLEDDHNKMIGKDKIQNIIKTAELI